MTDAEQLFYERVFTDTTLRELAEREESPEQTLYARIQSYNRRHIDEIELNAMVAYKEDNVLALAIPAQAADEQELAVRYFDHVVRELRKRDFPVKVHYRATEDGAVACFLEWTPERKDA
jgi:hypothetical protein